MEFSFLDDCLKEKIARVCGFGKSQYSALISEIGVENCGAA